MGEKVVVLGTGEIGLPLLQLIRDKHEAVGIDVEPVEIHGSCSVMHVCYPYEIGDFVRTTVDYVERYLPSLVVVNSTVKPGTTRAIHEASGVAAVHSPVRGKHQKMRSELLHYTKFVGPIDAEAGRMAAEHFEALGVKVRVLDSPEATELAKLSETTYFGVLIAWAQEVERYCIQLGVNYDQVTEIFQEIGYLPPVKYFPGVIGGHCVMPNIAILKQVFSSGLLSCIEHSNELKIELTESESAPSIREAKNPAGVPAEGLHSGVARKAHR